MEFRRLGRSGLSVSEIAYGNWLTHASQVEEEQAHACIKAALDAGITTFDTADVYANTAAEAVLGRGLAGQRRESLEICTKVFWPTGPKGPNDKGLGRKHIMESAHASLKRLGTDYIDLYQMHAPDPAAPIEETLSALDDLVREGKVRYLGHSNFAGWQIADAHWSARSGRYAPFVSAQNHYSLLERTVRHEVLPACRHFGLGLLPYFPLASGLLTGKYRRGEPPPADSRLGRMEAMARRTLTERNFDRVEALGAFAAERGHSLLELAFCWLLSQPEVRSVIAGATSPEQVAGNARAAADWRLTADELSEIDRILAG